MPGWRSATRVGVQVYFFDKHVPSFKEYADKRARGASLPESTEPVVCDQHLNHVLQCPTTRHQALQDVSPMLSHHMCQPIFGLAYMSRSPHRSPACAPVINKPASMLIQLILLRSFDLGVGDHCCMMRPRESPAVRARHAAVGGVSWVDALKTMAHLQLRGRWFSRQRHSQAECSACLTSSRPHRFWCGGIGHVRANQPRSRPDDHLGGGVRNG